MVRFIQVLGLALVAASVAAQAPINAQEKDVEENRVVTPSAPFVRRETPPAGNYLEQDAPQLGEPPQASEASLLDFHPMAGRQVVVVEESPALSVLRTSPGTMADGENKTPPEPPTIKEGEIRETGRGTMFGATIDEFRWSYTNPNRLEVGFLNTISGNYTVARFCNLETGEILDDSSVFPAFKYIEDNLGAPIRIWLSEYEIGEKRRNPRWRRGSSEPEFTIRPSRYYCIESFFLSAVDK